MSVSNHFPLIPSRQKPQIFPSAEIRQIWTFHIRGKHSILATSLWHLMKTEELALLCCPPKTHLEHEVLEVVAVVWVKLQSI